MSGFGAQPAGGSPYGVGTPGVQEDLGGKILDEPGAQRIRGSRYINAKTGDYVMNTSGRIAGMDDIKQLVILRVKTTKGSAAYQRLGHELKKIDRITANVKQRIQSTLTEAVQDLVDNNVIEVIGVEVELVRPGTVFTRFRWRNLLADQEDGVLIFSGATGGGSGAIIETETGEAIFI